MNEKINRIKYLRTNHNIVMDELNKQLKDFNVDVNSNLHKAIDNVILSLNEMCMLSQHVIDNLNMQMRTKV